MRIVHVEDYFDPTAGYQVNELVYANGSFDDDVYIITSTDMTPFHKKLDAKLDKEFELATGAKIIRLKTLYKLSSRVYLKGLWKTIDAIKPDILFLHGIGDFKDLILFKKKKPYKIVRDCHMSWIASRNKLRKIYYEVFKLLFSTIINKSNKYEVIYALGDEEYEYLRGLGISSNKIKYLRHGYNSNVMYYDKDSRKKVRELYGFDDEDIVVTYIGKFDSYKRPDIIFDIFDEMEDQFKKRYNIKLLFIGPKDASYMELFNNKLNNRVNKVNTILDNAKPFIDLRKYFSASDICIFPKETTLSSIHAQVCGCQVVMEKYTSNIERVTNSSNLYSVGNINEAKEILCRMIINQEYHRNYNNKEVEKLSVREYKSQIAILRSLA